MSFRDILREHKQQGEREWNRKRLEEQKRLQEEEARRKAEEDQKRALEAERDRRKAEAVFAGLPELVQKAAAQGLDAAVLAESFLEEKPCGDGPTRTLVVNRRTFHLTGWMIPFHDLCQENGVPLTVVSERVDVGIGKILHRTFSLLAVDLRRL